MSLITSSITTSVVTSRSLFAASPSDLILAFPDAAFDVALAPFVLSVVPDPAMALDEMWRVVRPGGEIVAYGSSPKPLDLAFPVLLAKNLQLKFFMVYHLAAADRARASAALQRLLARGELQHNIAARMALAEIVKAHETVESGRLPGNLVLRVAAG